MRINTIELPHGLLLGPMAGSTDRTFRRLCREHGAEYTVTEMVSAKAIHYRDRKTDDLAAPYEGEGPYAIQLFGSDPDCIAEACLVMSEKHHPDVIDINMGCPVRKVTQNGDGSALMRTPETVSAIVAAAVKASPVPVTVKIRAGWDDDSRNAVDIALRCEAAGAAMIAVHGRTKAQLYEPPVDLDIIADVKRAVKIPVVGNGGVTDAASAREMLDRTGCDGLMIARGAWGNPWIFEEIAAMLEGREYTPPTEEARLQMARRHLDMLLADKGEGVGIPEARHVMAWYCRGMPGSASIRGGLNSAATREEMLSLLDSLTNR